MSLIVNSKNTADNNGLNLSLNKPNGSGLSSLEAAGKMAAMASAASTASKCKSSHSIDAILGIRAAAAQAQAQANHLGNKHLFSNNSHHSTAGKTNF